MTALFLKMHHFFKKNTLVFLLFLFSVLVCGAFSLTHLHLEEDISNVLPSDGGLAKFEQLIEKTASGNNLIFILKSEDGNVEKLVKAGNELQTQLQFVLPDSLVASYNILNDESVFLDLLSSIYGNLSAYLSPKDLGSLDLDPIVLENNLDKKLKVLFTPAGSMMKESITQDPLNLSLLALKKMQALQIDNNFEFVNSCLISKDSTYLIGFVKLNPSIHLPNQKNILQTAVASVLAELNEQTTIKHFVFGASIISEENAQRIKKDIMLTVNIAATILLLGMAFYYRSIIVLPGFIIPILLGASVALIFLFLKQEFVSAISLGMGSVLLGTIIDYSLHILTHLRKTGDSEATIQHTAAPIIAGSVTTSTAFLCLLLIQSKALSDLAFFAAISMLFGAFFAIIIIPIIFKKTFKNKPYKINFIDRWVSYPFHQNKVIVGVCFATVFLGIFFVKNIRFTEDLNELNYMSVATSEAEKELNKASNALQSNLLVIIEKKDLNAVLLATENLEKALQEDLKSTKIQEIKSVSSLLASKEKLEERSKNWTSFWTEEKINSVTSILYTKADQLGIQKQAFQGFIDQLEKPNKKFSSDISSLAENYVSYNKEDNSYLSTLIIKLEKEDKQEIVAKIKAVDEDNNVVDKSNMIVGLIYQVKSSLQKISYLLLGLILGILFLYFRKAELVLLAFIPVFLSWITTLGLMGLFHIPFNMLNIIIVIFVFGLGIDYAIFILNSLIHDYQEGEEHFNTVKASVLLSAFTTFVGIGVLYFAKHPALHSIALAGIIAILSVFIYALVLLPFLFQVLVKNRVTKGFEPISLKGVYDTFLSYTTLIFGIVVITLLGYLLGLLYFIPLLKRKYFFHQAFHFWATHYIKIIYPKKRNFYSNSSKETFDKPSVIIANHQSLLDTLILVSLHPKIIVLTKDWVRNSPLFGWGARLADFYSVEGDQEELVQNLKQKVNEGYSVAIFPEGTRSTSRNLIRFYRGAFLLSEQLELDIVPVMIHGTIDTLHKDQFFGQRRNLHLSILDRIFFQDKSYGEDARERYKSIRNFYKKNYNKKSLKIENGSYFKKQILSNYAYKNTKLFQKAKKILKQFPCFDELSPFFQNDKKTLIIDEANGVLTLMQNLVNEKKEVSVVSGKLEVIQNCFLASSQNIYIKSMEDSTSLYEQVFYIGEEDFDTNLITKNTNENTNFIVLNLKTQKASFF